MKFIPYSNKQGLLLPNYVEDWIPESHLARVVDTVVEQLDTLSLERVYAEEGRPAYHPKMMLKVLFYAYATGLRSSRKIQKRLETDIAYIWLSGHQTPDFHLSYLSIPISMLRQRQYIWLKAYRTRWL
jgi:transposase